MSNGETLSMQVGKYSLKASGLIVIFILLIGGAVMAGVWNLEKHEHKMVEEHGRLYDEIQIQSYLLSLPESERPVLLAPAAIRGRIDRTR